MRQGRGVLQAHALGDGEDRSLRYAHELAERAQPVRIEVSEDRITRLEPRDAAADALHDPGRVAADPSLPWTAQAQEEACETGVRGRAGPGRHD